MMFANLQDVLIARAKLSIIDMCLQELAARFSVAEEIKFETMSFHTIDVNLITYKNTTDFIADAKDLNNARHSINYYA